MSTNSSVYPLFITIAIFVIVLGCNDSDFDPQVNCDEKLQKLREERGQEKQLREQLLTELDGINSYVDSLYIFQEVHEIDRLDALGKIQAMDSLIVVKNQKVDSLTKLLNENDDPFLNREIARYREQARIYQQNLDSLNRKLQKSEENEIHLENKVNIQRATINKKDQELMNLQLEKRQTLAEIKEAKNELLIIQEDKKQLEHNYRQKINDISNQYYSTGLKLFDSAERMIKLNQKKKRELTIEAYTLLTQSAKLGNQNARHDAEIIRLKYPKYFQQSVP